MELEFEELFELEFDDELDELFELELDEEFEELFELEFDELLELEFDDEFEELLELEPLRLKSRLAWRFDLFLFIFALGRPLARFGVKMRSKNRSTAFGFFFCAIAGDASVVDASSNVDNTDIVFFMNFLLFQPPVSGVIGKTITVRIYSKIGNSEGAPEPESKNWY